MDRKQFLSRSLHVAAGAFVAGPAILRAAAAEQEEPLIPGTENGDFAMKQIVLPYAYAALEPSIDAQTMEIHYTKHHAAYAKNIGEAITAEAITAANDIDFFANISKYSPKARNNGGGTWNHNFFWQVMGPGSTAAPAGKVADAISASFGDIEKFKSAFTEAAMKRFGSGWAWLVKHDGKLAIGSTPNQDNPLMDVSEFKGTPLLALDVWEHAYYLKYQNKRNEYVAAWWNVVNWDEVARRMA